jgi:SNF2 family DNA or RNA helicase
MLQLEGIGHEKVDFVEGLNVELLDFQRQTLKWTLERENTPGGIQSYFWAKLPGVPDRKDDLYYNPIVQRFRKDKPRVVRGGFIAEEMGLGKTVISLALILKNPAPLLPESGKPVSELQSNRGVDTGRLNEGWDKDPHKVDPTSNRKRGGILSRGTLVIVSYEMI